MAVMVIELQVVGEWSCSLCNGNTRSGSDGVASGGSDGVVGGVAAMGVAGGR